MAEPTPKGIRVTVLDHATGEEEVVEVPLHTYFVLATGDYRLAAEQRYSNGTVQLTLKRERPDA